MVSGGLCALQAIVNKLASLLPEASKQPDGQAAATVKVPSLPPGLGLLLLPALPVCYKMPLPGLPEQDVVQSTSTDDMCGHCLQLLVKEVTSIPSLKARVAPQSM